MKWLEKHIDPKLRELVGFALGGSSNEQIFTLKNIIEQPLEHGGSLIITYVDFKKVLDSIYGHTLWNILKMHSVLQE